MMLTRLIAVALLAASLSACSTVSYYAQSISGQMEIIRKREPIDELINAQATKPSLKEKLKLVRDIRRFASEQLGLPDNKSYKTYTDIKRLHVVWNVFAAPELSISPVSWCFPIAGCVSYRGYFKHEDAISYEQKLKEENYDTFVGGVPAYSTLGWFDDPLLSTVIDYPEADLAGLIFHELAHQVLYVKDDTEFNESFATAVELEGVKRWFQSKNQPEVYAQYLQYLAREQQVTDLILEVQYRLSEIYNLDQFEDRKRRIKRKLLMDLKQDYATLTSQWPSPKPYAGWFSLELNNAMLVVVAAYNRWVPAFQLLLDRSKGNLDGFFKAAETVGEMDKDNRKETLEGLLIGVVDTVRGVASTRPCRSIAGIKSAKQPVPGQSLTESTVINHLNSITLPG
ncbi:MAG: aminopeptidase [Arenicellales bacterium WSBS_2016_MAG_OTU3]